MNSQSQQLIQDLKTWSFEIEELYFNDNEIVLTSINKPSKYTIYLTFYHSSTLKVEQATHEYPRHNDFTFEVDSVYVDSFLDEEGEEVVGYLTKEHIEELRKYLESELEQEAYEKYEY